MANATTSYHDTDAGLRGRFAGLTAAIASLFNSYIESRSRAPQIAALNALSDEELAERGLTREGIPAYVFRDMFYI